ncbi:hypothetical protein ERJ75_000399700 [Trypanosoma vivax]|nr:hypothetical protein ERJ75_000399700 [Trypanosoma vivax]
MRLLLADDCGGGISRKGWLWIVWKDAESALQTKVGRYHSERVAFAKREAKPPGWGTRCWCGHWREVTQDGWLGEGVCDAASLPHNAMYVTVLSVSELRRSGLVRARGISRTLDEVGCGTERGG